MYEFAKEHNIDYIATGHYAKIIRDEKGIYRLLQSENVEKDQSYFLYGMTQRILSKVIFPLEDGDKEQVFQMFYTGSTAVADFFEIAGDDLFRCETGIFQIFRHFFG